MYAQLRARVSCRTRVARVGRVLLRVNEIGGDSATAETSRGARQTVDPSARVPRSERRRANPAWVGVLYGPTWMRVTMGTGGFHAQPIELHLWSVIVSVIWAHWIGVRPRCICHCCG